MLYYNYKQLLILIIYIIYTICKSKISFFHKYLNLIKVFKYNIM